MGGLFAANLLARAGWDVEIFERVGEELAGRGAGIVTHDELFDVHPARRRGDRRHDRLRDAFAHDARPRGQRRRGNAARPDTDRMGQALPAVEGRVSAPRATISTSRSMRVEQNDAGGHRAFCRRLAGERRPPDRRRRHPLDGARAVCCRRRSPPTSATSRGAGWSTKPPSSEEARRVLSDRMGVLPAARRADADLSRRRSATIRRARASAASISSGTGPPTSRPSCARFSPTRRAATTSRTFRPTASARK